MRTHTHAAVARVSRPGPHLFSPGSWPLTAAKPPHAVAAATGDAVASLSLLAGAPPSSASRLRVLAWRLEGALLVLHGDAAVLPSARAIARAGGHPLQVLQRLCATAQRARQAALPAGGVAPGVSGGGGGGGGGLGAGLSQLAATGYGGSARGDGWECSLVNARGDIN